MQREASVIWTIAGSDSGAGAGLQADVKVAQALGVHAATVVTAVTAQSPRAVEGKALVPEALVSAQIAALKGELPPGAIKTGMLGTGGTVRAVAEAIMDVPAFTVCDPVMVASSGASLLDESGVEALKDALLPRVDLLTPNLPEAERLLGRPISTHEEREVAAKELLSSGAKQVLLKGGHAGSEGWASDYWTDGSRGLWLHSPRRFGPFAHGTGCTLSAAIASARATGLSLIDSLCLAKAFLNRAIRLATRVSKSVSVLSSGPWPADVAAEDMPWLSESRDPRRPDPFPEDGELGFYPIVDRAAWLERLIPSGVRAVQLRIKDLRGEELESEIAIAAGLARRKGCRLYVNDYWELARKHGAYGVHLGQEDLSRADLTALRRTGLRLGLSTHCYEEVARALAVRPSYLAVGPVFPTTAKKMRFAPQGLQALGRWRALVDLPLVAIGGITLDHAKEVRNAGINGVAVISDITRSEAPEARARAWMEAFSG